MHQTHGHGRLARVTPALGTPSTRCTMCPDYVPHCVQHYIAGGCTHTFEEGGVEFDTGVHYVGNIAKRRKYLNFITDTPVEWDQLGTAENGWVYDEVR